MLKIDRLTYHINNRCLLDDSSATLNKGDRVGLVGRNGTGKSTLLRLISGDIPCAEVIVSDRVRVGKVHQDAPSGPQSLIETVLATDHERTKLIDDSQTETDPERLSALHDRLNAIDAARAPARAARILAGLGFDEDAQHQPCAALSGGWKMRVALAALLFADPDLLLLDEPTNHLDLESTLWLDSYLRAYSGTLLLVSHDRALLNNVCTRILHLEQSTLKSYSGNYDQFEQTRREQRQLQAAQQAKQQAQIAHMQSFVDRFRASASKARQAQSRLKALEKMKPIVPLCTEQSRSFDFPTPDDLPPPLLSLDRICAGYDPQRPVLKQVSLRLDQDDRIALLGTNGQGKSTLMKILAGRLAPFSGEVIRSPKLRIGYFSQDQADELDLSATPFDLMARALPTNSTPEKIRAQLGRFGFGEDHIENKVGTLSGGEKSRLLFALMTRTAPHLLLMDEPTNHLDIDSRQALIESMNSFNGAIVIVSHDPHLLRLSTDRLFLVKGGAVTPFTGDLDDYRKETATDGPKDPKNKNTPSKKDKRKADAHRRAATSDLRKAVRAAEQKIEHLESQQAELESRLADPKTWEKPPEVMKKLTQDKHQTDKELTSALESWERAQEDLDRALTPGG